MPIDEDYYERVKEANLSPGWRRPPLPNIKVAPHVWPWEATEAFMHEAAESPMDSLGSRRNLSLVNPGFNRLRHGTISTISTAIQLIKPGEVATAHRHPATALRFIMFGNGKRNLVSTVVNGEKVYLDKGDLVLTPSMCWHDHKHSGAESDDMIWMDALDSPFMQYLEVLPGDQYPEDEQPVTAEPNTTISRFGRGLMRSITNPPTERTWAMLYTWDDAYGALLDSVDESPFDGVAMEYINPIDGGHTLPTITCMLQRLRPGEHTRAHRHNHSVVYNVHQGKGATIVEGVKYDWKEHDIVSLPAGAWHEHLNASETEDAVMFSMSDLPVIEASGLAREEEGDYQEIKEAQAV